MIDRPAMLYATINLDLPSHPALREPTLLEWLAKLIGRKPTVDTGDEVTAVDGVLIFQRVISALSKLALEDVLSIRVDGEVAYVDLVEDSGDLPTAVAELETRGLLEHGVNEMVLVLSEQRDGLRVIAEIHLRRRVRAGTPELRIDLSARLDSMLPKKGEGPAAFAARLRELAQDGVEIQQAYSRFENLCARSEAALGEAFEGIAQTVERSPVRLSIHRPGPVELARMRRLPWNASIERPRYHATPRNPALGDMTGAFERHYFDLYFDFACWVTISELSAGRGWRGLDYTVVEADGSPAFTAETAEGERPYGGVYEGLAPGESPITLDGDELTFHPSVIAAARERLDEARPVDPRDVPGFAGGSGDRGFEARGEEPEDPGTGDSSCGT